MIVLSPISCTPMPYPSNNVVASNNITPGTCLSNWTARSVGSVPIPSVEAFGAITLPEGNGSRQRHTARVPTPPEVGGRQAAGEGGGQSWPAKAHGHGMGQGTGRGKDGKFPPLAHQMIISRQQRLNKAPASSGELGHRCSSGCPTHAGPLPCRPYGIDGPTSSIPCLRRSRHHKHFCPLARVQRPLS